jgi:hypothetical protein
MRSQVHKRFTGKASGSSFCCFKRRQGLGPSFKNKTARSPFFFLSANLKHRILNEKRPKRCRTSSQVSNRSFSGTIDATTVEETANKSVSTQVGIYRTVHDLICLTFSAREIFEHKSENSLVVDKSNFDPRTFILSAIMLYKRIIYHDSKLQFFIS